MQGTITEMNPARGMFLVAIEDGSHALFTLYDHIDLKVGDRVSGGLAEMGSERLLHLHSRQRFDAFGETGPGTLESCRRLLWP